MEHPTISELLEFHDGTLPPDASALLQSHLEICPSCSRELVVHREIGRAVNSAVSEALSRESVQRILDAAIPAMPAPRRARRFEFSVGNIGFGVFIAAVLAMTTYFFLRSVPGGGTNPGSNPGTSIVQQTLSFVDEWRMSASEFNRHLLEPFRMHSSDAVASTMLIVLPVLLLLFLVDRYLSKVLRSR